MIFVDSISNSAGEIVVVLGVAGDEEADVEVVESTEAVADSEGEDDGSRSNVSSSKN